MQRSLNAIIDQIYDGIFDDSVFACLATHLAEATDARGCILMGMDFQYNLTSMDMHYFVPDMPKRYVAEGLGAMDIWTHIPARQGVLDQCILCEDYISAEEFARSGFFHEQFKHFGDDTARCMGAVMSQDGGYLAIGVHRPLGGQPFERRELNRLEAIFPHLRRVIRARARLRAEKAELSRLQGAFDCLAAAIIITDAQGKVQVMNTVAEELVSSGDGGLQVVMGVLTTRSSGLRDRLAFAVRSAAHRKGRKGDALRIRQLDGSRDLEVLVVPVNASQPSALVIFNPAEGANSTAIDILGSLFGLTVAELAITESLLKGLSPYEISVERDTSLATVRTQIKSLIAKSDARNLIEYVRRVTALPKVR